MSIFDLFLGMPAEVASGMFDMLFLNDSGPAGTSASGYSGTTQLNGSITYGTGQSTTGGQQASGGSAGTGTYSGGQSFTASGTQQQYQQQGAGSYVSGQRQFTRPPGPGGIRSV